MLSIEAAAKHWRTFTLASLALGLSACATPPPETASVVVQTKTPPVRNITSFSAALRCMDDLFLSNGYRNIIITSAGIPDATGEISTGTREMLISAISRMSVRSNAFRYVDYDPLQIDVHQLHQLVDSSGQFRAPSYYIRGAITQLDEGVLNSSQGFGFSFAGTDVGLDFGVNKNQVVSLVTLDMNLAHFKSRQILPGMSANNSLAVVRSGRAADAGGRIKKAGIFFNISLDQSEGVHQGVRTLVELGAIETLGKLTKVPYWNCLQIEATNPAVRAEASNWFQSLKLDERITFVQRALTGSGYYSGPINGVLDQNTSDAIAVYQRENNLIPSGRVDFQLYLGLLQTNKKLAGKTSIAEGEIAQAEREQPDERQPVGLTLLSTRGNNPVYKRGENLTVAARVSRNAYLYCYYKDAQGAIARIYPNRFQPDAYVAGGKGFLIPSPDSPFRIMFDKAPVSEEITCLASDRELSLQLPRELKVADLAPLPVKSMESLINFYRQLDTKGLAVARLPVEVK